MDAVSIGVDGAELSTGAWAGPILGFLLLANVAQGPVVIPTSRAYTWDLGKDGSGASISASLCWRARYIGDVCQLWWFCSGYADVDNLTVEKFDANSFRGTKT